MAVNFAVILLIATIVTGIFWCLEKYLWQPARQRKVEAVRQQTDSKANGQLLAEVGKPKRSVEFLASLFPVILIVFLVRSFVVEPFQIPSGSMMPTLLVGDFILVDKFSYGLRNPINNQTLIATGKPKRGDIVVFKYPRNPQLDYIKRLVGLPGDRIVYNAETKTLTIYPSCQQEPAASCDSSKPLNISYSAPQPAHWVEVINGMQTYFYTDQEFDAAQIRSDPQYQGDADMTQRQETLGQVQHNILVVPLIHHPENEFYQQPGQPIGQWIVPANSYFMMGDNRDNSEDSRYWGFVPEENLVGRAFGIWLSLDKQPGEWPSGIRWQRIGGIN